MRDARACFPGLADKVFLDAATVSLAPTQSQEAIQRFLDLAVHCPERDASTHHIAMDDLRGHAVRGAAALLGAGEDEIALVESTTHGLNIAALALPHGPGDNVVISDLEFLQVAIPWTKLVEEGSLGEVRVARNVDGAVTVDSIAEQLDAHTCAVVVRPAGTSGEQVEQHVLGLAGLLRDELELAGLRLVSRPESETRSGITTFMVSGDPDEDEALLQRLLEQRIFVSRRYTSHVGGIRVSTHYYNDESDIERLVAAVRAAAPRRPARTAA